MDNTPIQRTTNCTQVCLKRILASLALFIALTCTHAKALESAPYWEEINGVNHYGYWQEIYAGYYNESAGYWDYSAGNGHIATTYGNPVYDEQGNLISEDLIEVWIPDPAWVSVPEWVPPVIIWVDLTPPDQETSTNEHSVEFKIDIRPDIWLSGKKAWCKMTWSVDDQGTVTDKQKEGEIFKTEIQLWGLTIYLPTGGHIDIDDDISGTGATLRLHGNAWTSFSPLQSGIFGSTYLNWDFSPFDIDWNINVYMDYQGNAPSTGGLSGWHNQFPSYNLKVDDREVYDFPQAFDSLMTGNVGLILKQPVYISF